MVICISFKWFVDGFVLRPCPFISRGLKVNFVWNIAKLTLKCLDLMDCLCCAALEITFVMKD